MSRGIPLVHDMPATVQDTHSISGSASTSTSSTLKTVIAYDNGTDSAGTRLEELVQSGR
jgi:hypothetical protein